MTDTVANWPQEVIAGNPEDVFALYVQTMEVVRADAVVQMDMLWDAASDLSINEFAPLAADLARGYLGFTWSITSALQQLYVERIAGFTLGLPLPEMPFGGVREVPIWREYRWPQSVGIKYGDPERARRVLHQLLQSDLQLAQLNGSLAYFQSDHRVGSYGREIINQANACAFCTWHQGDYSAKTVMPLHPNCKCLVRPRVKARHYADPSRSAADHREMDQQAQLIVPPEATQEITT